MVVILESIVVIILFEVSLTIVGLQHEWVKPYTSCCVCVGHRSGIDSCCRAFVGLCGGPAVGPQGQHGNRA